MRILSTLPEGETRKVLIPPALRERLEALGDVTWNESAEPFPPAEFADRLA